MTNSENSRVNKPNLSLTDVLRCFLILFKSILSIFALNFFVEEQTQLKWTTNYKINKMSFKVAWEKASDVVTADWLNLKTWNVPVNHDMLRVAFSRLLFAQKASVPAFLHFCIFWSVPLTLKYPGCQRVFFPCCLRQKLSGEAAIVMITALSLNFCRKQQENKPSGTQGNPKHGCKKIRNIRLVEEVEGQRLIKIFGSLLWLFVSDVFSSDNWYEKKRPK